MLETVREADGSSSLKEKASLVEEEKIANLLILSKSQMHSGGSEIHEHIRKHFQSTVSHQRK